MDRQFTEILPEFLVLRLFEVDTNDHDRALGSNDTSKLFDDFRFVTDVYCLKHENYFSNNDVIFHV